MLRKNAMKCCIVSYSRLFQFVVLCGLVGCASSPTAVVADKAPLSLQWEIVASPYSGTNQTLSLLTISNQATDTLDATGWTIYFNNVGTAEITGPDTALAGIGFINGDFFSLSPRQGWKPLAPGDSVQLRVLSRRLKNMTDLPKGFYLVDDGHPEGTALPLVIKPFAQADSLEIGLAARIYAQNETITDVSVSALLPVLPTPVAYAYTTGVFKLDPTVPIITDAAFEPEASYLQSELAKVLDRVPEIAKAKQGKALVLRQKAGGNAEGYSLTVDTTGVVIEAATRAGAFYGIQTLKNLLPPTSWADKQPAIAIPGITLTDAPQFAHRAVMLDVARNFQTKEQVMKILDLLALYKVNIMHFHLTEDEAWRLEIPGLPELTDVGAKRGHTLDDARRLMPSYGSGPDADNATGSGFYSRADYIELLQYAAARHIRVIPEIETPGHARAAIKSMDARYASYLAKGDSAAASQYLLRDLEDQSAYRSVQHWNDNVINVAVPSAYVFLEKVVDELIAIYKEAGAPLETIHFGGDEVPNGVWERSPAVRRLLAADRSVPHTDDLWHYYFNRINKLLSARGLYLSGWEEIGMKKAVVNGRPRMVVEPRFARENFHTDVWANQGANVDLAYRLANAGYKVVLTNVTNFYIDLAYNESFYEPGQYWGGYVDIEKLFRFVPYDYYRSLEEKASGERLTAAGRANIVGLQAPLWSEIITSPERMEYLLLPKLLGFAERAWAADPAWASESNERKTKALYAADWSAFLNALGKRELSRLDHYGGGYQYRIPTAGVAQRDSKLAANVQFPGFVIRYTTDGSEPTAQSAVYTEPLPATGTVAFRVFNAAGRGGRTVYWK
ncbi:family 20 glycosylhydrolase [Parapedobacter koreensis]|nr:family 20 glycosylhydrolase [Parapedobacter koreensis]